MFVKYKKIIINEISYNLLIKINNFIKWQFKKWMYFDVRQQENSTFFDFHGSWQITFFKHLTKQLRSIYQLGLSTRLSVYPSA